MNPRRVRKGARPQVGDINRLIDEIDALKRSVARQELRAAAAGGPAIRVFAVNKTGDDLRQGDAAAFDGSPYSTLQELQANGIVARLDAFAAAGSGDVDPRPWAVAENLIRADEGGWVFVSGMCVARCTGSGDYAGAPEAGGVVLERGTSGAPVIQEMAATAEAGGGDEKWCLIRMIPSVSAAGADGPVDQAQVLDAQTATAGTATTAPRSDGKPGVLLVGNPSEAEVAAAATLYGDLEAVKDDAGTPVRKGFRVRANRAAYEANGNANPTLFTAGDKGFDILLADYGEHLAAIEATASGLGVPLDDDAGNLLSTSGLGLMATAPKLDDCGTPDDNTDLDVSTAKHGLCPKAPNDTSKFLRGDGSWAAPAGGGEHFVGRQTDESSESLTCDNNWNEIDLSGYLTTDASAVVVSGKGAYSIRVRTYGDTGDGLVVFPGSGYGTTFGPTVIVPLGGYTKIEYYVTSGMGSHDLLVVGWFTK